MQVAAAARELNIAPGPGQERALLEVVMGVREGICNCRQRIQSAKTAILQAGTPEDKARAEEELRQQEQVLDHFRQQLVSKLADILTLEVAELRVVKLGP